MGFLICVIVHTRGVALGWLRWEEAVADPSEEGVACGRNVGAQVHKRHKPDVEGAELGRTTQLPRLQGASKGGDKESDGLATAGSRDAEEIDATPTRRQQPRLPRTKLVARRESTSPMGGQGVELGGRCRCSRTRLSAVGCHLFRLTLQQRTHGVGWGR